MAGKNFLTYGVIGAAGIYLASKAYNATNAVKNLAVSRARISKVKLNLFSIDITMMLEVNNPSSVTIPFDYFTGSILYQGNKLANFGFDGHGQNIQLKSRSITPVTFLVAVSTPALVSKIFQLLKDIGYGKKVDTIFTIQGTFSAAGVDIPVSFTYDIRPGAVNGIGRFGFGSPALMQMLARRRQMMLNRRHKPGALAHWQMINEMRRRKHLLHPIVKPAMVPAPVVNPPRVKAPGITTENYSGVPSNEIRGLYLSDQW